MTKNLSTPEDAENLSAGENVKTGTASNFATPARKDAWFTFLLHASLNYYYVIYTICISTSYPLFNQFIYLIDDFIYKTFGYICIFL